MRGRRASLLARGRRVWVSHTCAAGDISRTFASATAAGFPRVRGGRRMARTAPGAGAVFFRLCAKARPCVTAICKERPSEEAKLLLPGLFFARAARGASLWDGKEGFENRGIAEETACAGCLAVRRRFARRGTWSEPCPMRRRYSPRRGTWSEQAENCRHLDFSFPSRRDGPALGRARFVRGDGRKATRRAPRPRAAARSMRTAAVTGSRRAARADAARAQQPAAGTRCALRACWACWTRRAGGAARRVPLPRRGHQTRDDHGRRAAHRAGHCAARGHRAAGRRAC